MKCRTPLYLSLAPPLAAAQQQGKMPSDILHSMLFFRATLLARQIDRLSTIPSPILAACCGLSRPGEHPAKARVPIVLQQHTFSCLSTALHA